MSCLLSVDRIFALTVKITTSSNLAKSNTKVVRKFPSSNYIKLDRLL